MPATAVILIKYLIGFELEKNKFFGEIYFVLGFISEFKKD